MFWLVWVWGQWRMMGQPAISAWEAVLVVCSMAGVLLAEWVCDQREG